MQQHQQQQRQQQQQQQQANSQQQHTNGAPVTDILSDIQNKDLNSIGDKELEALISQQDIGSFAESLLKEIQADAGGESIDLGSEDVKSEDKDDTNNSDTKAAVDKSSKTKQEIESLKISSLDIPTQVETIK